MATHFPDDQSSAMVARTRRLLLSPEREWATIDAEPMSAVRLFLGWAVPLAAIGPVANCARSMLFGIEFLGLRYQPSVAMSVATAISAYAMALVGVWLLALVIDALAPSFGGDKDSTQAMKVAVFAMVPAWLSGIFGLVPGIGFLSVVGLYSLYLVYLGLPQLMRAPAEKALVYTAAVIVAAIVLMLVADSLAASVGGRFAAPGTTVV